MNNYPNYVEGFLKYADFRGRASRTEYWMFSMVSFVVACAFVIADLVFKPLAGSDATVLTGVYLLFALSPTLAVTSRRLHDTGRSAWWTCVGFVPLVGGIWLTVLLAKDTVPGGPYVNQVSLITPEEDTYAKAA